MARKVSTYSYRGAPVEKVPRPIAWEISYPEMLDNDDIEVTVRFFVHNGTSERKGDQLDATYIFYDNESCIKGDELDSFTFYIPKEKLTSKLDKVLEMGEDFYRIRELRRMSKVRDELHLMIHQELTEAYDNAGNLPRQDVYREVLRKLYHDGRCRKRFKCLVTIETLIALTKKQKCFQSEKIQQYLFA